MKKLRKTYKDLKRTWFGRYILINIFVALLGIPVGIFVGIYLLLFPFDESEYNKYTYYVNRAGNIEKAQIAIVKDKIPELVYYYECSNNPNIKTFSYWSTDIINMPFETKVKILKEYNEDVMKVKVFYKDSFNKERVEKGYLYKSTIHTEPPDKERILKIEK